MAGSEIAAERASSSVWPNPAEMKDSSVSTRTSQEQKLHPNGNAWNNFSVGEERKKMSHALPDENLGVRIGNGIL